MKKDLNKKQRIKYFILFENENKEKDIITFSSKAELKRFFASRPDSDNYFCRGKIIMGYELKPTVENKINFFI